MGILSITGISLNPKLLERLDRSVSHRGSKPVRYLIRDRLIAEQLIVRGKLANAEHSADRSIGPKGVHNGRPVITIPANPPERCHKHGRKNSLSL